MSRVQKGERVAIQEFHPTDRRINAIHTGTVKKPGANGAQVQFDDRVKFPKEVWVVDSRLHFVVREGDTEHAPILSKTRPPRNFASSISKQQIEPKTEEHMANKSITNNGDALDRLMSSGIDPLRLWEDLGARIAGSMTQELAAAKADVAKATEEKAIADKLVNDAMVSLRNAETMATAAKQQLHDAVGRLEEVETKMGRLQAAR